MKSYKEEHQIFVVVYVVMTKKIITVFSERETAFSYSFLKRKSLSDVSFTNTIAWKWKNEEFKVIVSLQ
jgi:hypothetical protein